MAKKCVLGVDVGTSSVKAMIGTMDAQGSVLIKGIGTAPTAGFSKGVITDARDLAAAAAQAAECAIMVAGATADEVYFGFGGVDIASVNSTGSVAPAAAGTITGGDVARACRAAAIVAVADDRRIVHAIPSAFRLDGHEQPAAPIGLAGGKLEVDTHIVTMPAAVTDELLDAFAAEGMTATGLLANCVASLEAMTPADTDAVLLLDIGAGLTDLALHSGGAIRFSASVPLGGDYITGDIMQGIGVDYKYAEEIKRYYGRLNKGLRGRGVILDCGSDGTGNKKVNYDFLHKIVESRVEEIVAILYGYLEPVLFQHDIRKIYLTGGAALLPSMGEKIAAAFGKPAELLPVGGELPAEYARHENTACYSLIKYCAKLQSAPEPDGPSSLWRSIVRKLKAFI